MSGWVWPRKEVCATCNMYLHGGAVELTVGLAARAPHRGALAAVEHPEVDGGLVDGAAHDAVERVHFAHLWSTSQIHTHN